MRKVTFALFIVLFVTALPACRHVECEKLNNPELPTTVKGWEEFSLGKDTIIYGDFVLHRGGMVDNGKIGIEVVELHPAKCGPFVDAREEFPSARIRFFKISDHKVICDFTFRRGSARLDTLTTNPEDMPWSVIEISNVNARKNWVSFNLRKR